MGLGTLNYLAVMAAARARTPGGANPVIMGEHEIAMAMLAGIPR